MAPSGGLAGWCSVSGSGRRWVLGVIWGEEELRWLRKGVKILSLVTKTSDAPSRQREPQQVVSKSREQQVQNAWEPLVSGFFLMNQDTGSDVVHPIWRSMKYLSFTGQQTSAESGNIPQSFFVYFTWFYSIFVPPCVLDGIFLTLQIFLWPQAILIPHNTLKLSLEWENRHNSCNASLFPQVDEC